MTRQFATLGTDGILTAAQRPPDDDPTGTPITDTFTGDGAQTTFTLSQTATGTWGIAAVNGAQLLPSEFAISGTSVVFDTAPANLAEVAVTYVWGGGLGGGGAALVFSVAILDFQETPGAGTYTASVPIVAHGVVWMLYAVRRGGLWDADTAPLNVGDTQGGSEAYVASLLLTGEPTAPYSNTQLNIIPDGYEDLKGLGGAYSDGGLLIRQQEGVYRTSPGILYDSADTITATVVTTGAGGSAGHLQVMVYGFGLQGGFVSAVKT